VAAVIERRREVFFFIFFNVIEYLYELFFFNIFAYVAEVKLRKVVFKFFLFFKLVKVELLGQVVLGVISFLFIEIFVNSLKVFFPLVRVFGFQFANHRYLNASGRGRFVIFRFFF
jgi:hypothetical protein